MARFASITDRVDGPMRRARALVEHHIATYGMVPHPDKMKEAIAVELGLAEIRAIDRGQSGRTQQLVASVMDIERATQIVAEFESIFGQLTATERRWLIRRMAGQEV